MAMPVTDRFARETDGLADADYEMRAVRVVIVGIARYTTTVARPIQLEPCGRPFFPSREHAHVPTTQSLTTGYRSYTIPTWKPYARARVCVCDTDAGRPLRVWSRYRKELAQSSSHGY